MPAARRAAEFDRRVFINFPFDAPFLPLLHAIVFTIHDCGFESKSALQDTGSGESRIDKIARFIDDCRYSIHELGSIDATAGPRLNMAFECGLAYGARVFGAGRRGAPNRDFLGLAAAPFFDKAALSDLGGKDLKYHDGRPMLAIEAVRMFLAAKGKQLGIQVRDHEDIVRRFEQFEGELPETLATAGALITPKSIGTLNYLPEWTNFAAVWLAAHA